MLQFGFLAAVFWWVLIAFNMCLEVSSLPSQLKKLILIFISGRYS